LLEEGATCVITYPIGLTLITPNSTYSQQYQHPPIFLPRGDHTQQYLHPTVLAAQSTYTQRYNTVALPTFSCSTHLQQVLGHNRHYRHINATNVKHEVGTNTTKSSRNKHYKIELQQTLQTSSRNKRYAHCNKYSHLIATLIRNKYRTCNRNT